jgi:2-dehydropantoate 2-reductase
MKVGIVGAGAMGCLFGSFLARAGQEVWLVDIWEDHISRIKHQGLKVVGKGKSDTVRVRATTHASDVGICDLVLVSTKFNHTRTAVQNAGSMINPETLVMTVQNGLGNVDIIAEFVDPRQIIFGLTTLGSVVRGPGEIEATFSEGAPTYVWPLKREPDDQVRQVIDTFRQTGLLFELSPDVRKEIWKKVCLNAGLSVPLAIPRLKCGDFIAQPSSLELIRGLVAEIATVAGKEGVAIEPEEAYEYVVSLAKQAPEHRPSPLMDVLNRRKTEVDCLNGAIVDIAKRHGVEVPYNTAIFHLIRIIESTYDHGLRKP